MLSKVFTSKDKAELYWKTWCEVKTKTGGGNSYVSQFEHYLLDVDTTEDKEILEIGQMINQEIWFKVNGEYDADGKGYRVNYMSGGYDEEDITDPHVHIRFSRFGHYYFQFYIKTQHFRVDQESYDLMKKLVDSKSFSGIIEEFAWTNSDYKIESKSILDFLSGNYRIVGGFIYDSVNNIGDYI